MTNLRRLLGAYATGVLPPAWIATEQQIAAERVAVDAYLHDPATLPVYGFTTLLGPLDNESAAADSPARLWRAHLVGRVLPAPPGLLRLATLAKLCQLSQGGSGISARTYRRIVDALPEAATATAGAWWDSYGSGDVVPGAWWADAVLGVESAPQLAPGDLIALINGSFFGAAAATLAFDRLATVLGDALAPVVLLAPPPPRGLGATPGVGPALTDLLAARAAASIPHGVQRPVSIRDHGPIVAAAAVGMTSLAAAIDRRLAGPSANPLFTHRSGRVEAHSQSSFLDVGLTMSVRSATTATLFVLTALQRFTELTAVDGLAVDGRRTELVQPPKVSMAVLREAIERAGGAGIAPLNQSGGVEDLADGAVAASRVLLDVVQLGAAIVERFDDVDAAAHGLRRELDAGTRPARQALAADIAAALRADALDADAGAAAE